MADIHYNFKRVREFENSLIDIVAYGTMGAAKQMKKRGKLLFQEVIDRTPPSGRGTRGIKAKQKGMRTVEGEIRKVIMGVDKRKDPNPTLSSAQLHAWHKRARTGGRVRGQPRRGKQLLVTSKSKLRDYIKKRQGAVGMLAAGWIPAAREFKVPGRYQPKWITRHNPGGLGSFRVTKKRITIMGTNAANHVAKVGVMQRSMDLALKEAARNNRLVIEDYKKKARAKGFRVR